MDMKKLFLDFKKHVEQLDDDAIKQSISRAVEHSINSSSLECEAEQLYQPNNCKVIEVTKGKKE